jgi:DNA-binding PadR family transcriptional regulator
MSRVFGHGDLRLYLLKLLDERPRHGYELIRLLEDRFYGLYTPSAGTIYPRLAALEEDGLVAHDVVDGRKVYRLTDAGREELAARGEQMAGLEDRVRASTRHLAREIKADVKASIRDLRAELKEATGQVLREERRARRSTRDDWHDELTHEVRRAVRSLQADARAFTADLVGVARTHGIDTNLVSALRDILQDARSSLADVIDGKPGAGSGGDASARSAADTETHPADEVNTQPGDRSE